MTNDLDPDTHYQLIAPLNQALQTARSNPDDHQQILDYAQHAHSEAERILPATVWTDRDSFYDDLHTDLQNADPDDYTDIILDAVDTVLDETFHLIEDE